jgi:hypothetical protein
MTFYDVVIGSVTWFDLIVFAVSVAITVIIARIVGTYLKRALSDRVDRGELDKLVRASQLVIIPVSISISPSSWSLAGQLD